MLWWVDSILELSSAKYLIGLPRQISGKEPSCQSSFDPWLGKIPWRKKWQPTPIFLPGEDNGQRSLAGYSPWDHRESDMT